MPVHSTSCNASVVNMSVRSSSCKIGQLYYEYTIYVCPFIRLRVIYPLRYIRGMSIGGSALCNMSVTISNICPFVRLPCKICQLYVCIYLLSFDFV